MVGPFRSIGAPVLFSASGQREPVPAPLVGEHTEAILAGVLGLAGAEIGRLYDDGVVA